MNDQTYSVREYMKDGKSVTISGMGRNKGTWDHSFNSRRTAQRHAAILRKERPGKTFKVETDNSPT